MTVDSIRARIQHVLDSTKLTDPRDIADRVLETSTQKDRNAWLAECLPEIARDVIGSQRNTALNETTRDRKPGRSPKVDQIRGWWSSFLAARIAVGAEWKSVGDCSAEDLTVVIEMRRSQAAAISAQADKYQTLLEYMRDHGATKVAELPADVMVKSPLAGVKAA